MVLALGEDTIGFADAPGWIHTAVNLPDLLQANDQVAWASNVGIAVGDVTGGWPQLTVPALPSHGIVVLASLADVVDDPETYPERSLPLSLGDGYFLAGNYEGQPAPNVSLQLVYAHVNGKYVLVQVFFGDLEPSADTLAAADAQLQRLTVPSA